MININTGFVNPALRPLGSNKIGFNVIHFNFNILGNLSMRLITITFFSGIPPYRLGGGTQLPNCMHRKPKS